jgi:hypothetical protein
VAEWGVLATILLLGAVCYSMRLGGFLVAGALPSTGLLARILRLIPGNLFVALVAVGVRAGGWPTLVGCLSALVTMKATQREWAALAAGFGAMALATLALGHR